MRRLATLIYVALMGAALCACAAQDGDLSSIHPSDFAAAYPSADHAQSGRDAQAPSGFLAFCDRNPGECRTNRGQSDRIAFTPELWATLEQINIAVNNSVRPRDDSEHYGVTEFWTVPVDGEGDCEDYVLAKKKMLTLLGLAAPALRITVAFNKKVRHAVLTVVTDHGDYVLDNLQDDVLPAGQVGYAWVARQDRASRTGWTALN